MGNCDQDKQHVQEQFWSLDEISPKKAHTVQHTPPDTETVMIESAFQSSERKENREPIRISSQSHSPHHRACPATSDEVYQPEHPLLRRVKICTWPSRYTFYENFRNDALRYAHEEGQSAPYVPFFSYMPQYVQMSAEQRAYYFWWREHLRRGEFLRADSSYLFLYIYEIINIPDVIPPSQGLQQLCTLWRFYREQYTILDRYLAEWVCDYCLIHRLTPPDDLLSPILGNVLHAATFREFYLSDTRNSDKLFASVLLNFVSPYQYRTGKYYTEKHAALFTKHMEDAVCAVIAAYRRDHKPFPHREDFPAPAHIARDSYSGSICAYNIKKHIEVDYYSCSGSNELRLLAADLIKCIENYLRGMIGVKSRFSVRTLPAEMKAYIAAYFAPYLPQPCKKGSAVAADTEPAYMKQYEASGLPFSLASAQKIEQDGWAVTARLTESFEETRDVSSLCSASLQAEKTASAVLPNHTESVKTTLRNDAADKADTALCTGYGDMSGRDGEAGNSAYGESITDLRVAASFLLADDRASFSAYASKHSLLPDTLAEEINNVCYEWAGDIVIEDTGNGFTVIPCYREDLEEWIHA